MGLRDLHMTNSDGTITATQFDYNWGDLLQERLVFLIESDLWMLADRYAQLSEEQQTELVEYRQALRDITDYEEVNDAADNFPTKLEWMI